MPVSLRRLARNQAIFREVNQRLREIASRPADLTDYLCECSEVGCAATVELDNGEYEAVRSLPNVFVIVPGHERLEVERVLEDNDRFMLVEKTVLIDDVDLSGLISTHRELRR
jgi:hypothetical protein